MCKGDGHGTRALAGRLPEESRSAAVVLGAALMGELLDRAFTEQRLLDAWGSVREAALADGDGGPEFDHVYRPVRWK